MSDLYGGDFMQWTEQQTELLRRRAAGQLPNDEGLDWLNLAEEIESVGVSQKREVRSRLRVICLHLLKWQHQPERRGASWESTLDEQRIQMQGVFEDSPSLRRFAASILPSAFTNARQDARRETGRDLVPNDECPWTLDQVLSIGFLPN